MTITKMDKKRKINSKPYAISLFEDLGKTVDFATRYDKWLDLAPRDKERVLLQFTLLSTPVEWISTLNIQGKEIKYIKQHIAKRILNLLFGIGNWHIEIVSIENLADEASYTAFGYGYLVLKWFDGSERKIATAGSGRVWKKNLTTGKGDDTKMVISDMIKKGLANLGLFADIYSSVEAVEDLKGAGEKGDNKVTYDYKLLSERVDLLIADYMDGIEVAERLQKAEVILKKAGFNDLLLKIKELN